jgi:outer membrane protein OmpA-like peptidoglycan-associated protein
VVLKDVTGKNWTTTTDDNGNFIFEIGSGTYRELSLTISKDQYLESASLFRPEKTDETDLLTDNLVNVTICIEKVPEEKPKEPEPLVIKAEDVVTVFFEFDRSLLKDEAISKLDSIYTMLVENPAATIQISGYTDGLGSAQYNAKLSDKRARSCADYLIKKGIEASRVTFVSFGACCPIEMELINGRDNPDGRSKNRRALINVKKN